jgi:hypothetical protein
MLHSPVVVAAILIGAALMPLLPAFFFGVPLGADFGFHLRLAQRFSNAAGFLSYPGWSGDANLGHGDMTFRLYPLGLPALLTLGYRLTGDWIRGFMLVWGVLSFCGVWGAFRFARVYVPDRVAVWAGILWAAMPYSNFEVYEASMLGDFAGNVVLPHVFAGVARLCRFGKAKDIFPCALTYGVLLNTHVPTGLIGSLAIGVFALTALAQAPADRRGDGMVRLALALAFGGAMGLRFVTVLLSEAGWIYPIGNPPRRTFVIEENFLSFSSPSLITLTLMIVFAVTGGLNLPTAGLLAASRGLRRAAFPALLLTCVGAFLMLPVSDPVWRVIPKLKDIQYPWRWLTVISATACVSTAIGIAAIGPRVRAGGVQRLIWLGVLGVAFGCGLYNLVFGVFHLEGMAGKARAKLAEPPGYPESVSYLPKWSYEGGVYPPAMTVPAQAGERRVSAELVEPARRKFRVGAGPAEPLRVRGFFHPYWRAFVDGVPVSADNGADGMLTVGIPERETLVELRFIEPWPVQTAGWISLLAGIAAVGGTLVFQLRRFQGKRG